MGHLSTGETSTLIVSFMVAAKLGADEYGEWVAAKGERRLMAAKGYRQTGKERLWR
jgi:hypothetical protein